MPWRDLHDPFEMAIQVALIEKPDIRSDHGRGDAHFQEGPCFLNPDMGLEGVGRHSYLTGEGVNQ